MELLSKEEAFLNKMLLDKEINRGKIFLHPTDTIYGLGCNAQDRKAVCKIRKIKKDLARPFSIIAPSKDWIYENCVVGPREEEWLEKLPGPYTLILKLKNKEAVDENVNNGLNTIGVRIPDHWISELISEIGVPFVTTAAVVGENELLEHPEECDEKYKKYVHYAFNDGYLIGRPSTIVDLVQDIPTIRKRHKVTKNLIH